MPIPIIQDNTGQKNSIIFNINSITNAIQKIITLAIIVLNIFLNMLFTFISFQKINLKIEFLFANI